MTPILELFFHLQNLSTDTSGSKEKDGNSTLSSPEIVTELPKESAATEVLQEEEVEGEEAEEAEEAEEEE